jgi:hypothetical protein
MKDLLPALSLTGGAHGMSVSTLEVICDVCIV